MSIASIKFNYGRFGANVIDSADKYLKPEVVVLVYKMKAISVRWTYVRQPNPGPGPAGNDPSYARFALSVVFIASSCPAAIAARAIAS